MESCQGVLGRLGAIGVLGKVVEDANPYVRWVTLVNQTCSVDALVRLWIATLLSTILCESNMHF